MFLRCTQICTEKDCYYRTKVKDSRVYHGFIAEIRTRDVCVRVYHVALYYSGRCLRDTECLGETHIILQRHSPSKVDRMTVLGPLIDYLGAKMGPLFYCLLSVMDGGLPW